MRTIDIRVPSTKPKGVKGTRSFFLTGGVSPPVTTIEWLKEKQVIEPDQIPVVNTVKALAFLFTGGVVDPNQPWIHRTSYPNPDPDPEVSNKRQQSWYFLRGVAPVPSPFVGSSSLVKRKLASFLNIRSESQQIRSASNLARVDPQVISHSFDALQSFGDITDSRLRELTTGVDSNSNAVGVIARGVAFGAFGPYGAYMPNPRYPKAYAIGSTSSGDVDLYTVPVNRRALLLGWVSTYITGGGGSVAAYLETKISGSYFRLTNTRTIINVGEDESSFVDVIPKVLNAGETASINLNFPGAGILSTWLHLVEFDAISPLRSVTLTSFNMGDNTLYTVPTGRTFEVLAFYGLCSSSGFRIQSRMFYSNASGGRRDIRVYAVPKGSVSASANKLYATQFPDIADGTVFTFIPLYGSLAEGDFINVNVDANTVGQMAWMNIIEH